MIIDNTQYTTFMRCQAEWVERYLNKHHKPYTNERDDAMAIGIGIHNVLENGYKNGKFVMTSDTADELTLTSEALLEVRTMAEAYRNQYPSGPVEFPWAGIEEPLSYAYQNHTIKAKVDGFFRTTEPTTINGGIGDIYLVPGIYSFETKSKSPGYDRGLYLADWQAAAQASFQILTMKANAVRLGFDPAEVRGVLVNVIERPKIYEPRRTCKGCDKLIEVKYYRLCGKIYHCPLCDYGNTFTGPMGKARIDPPFLYRFIVERSDERLAMDREMILAVGNQMDDLTHYYTTPIHNRTQCVNMQWRRKCEYYDPHNSLVPVNAIGYPGFVEFNPTAYLERKIN